MLALQPLRYAWRSLRRTPVFTSTAVLTLAIGIGAAAAIFAVVDGILLRPLSYGHPDQLVSASTDAPPMSLTHIGETSGMYFTYKRFARSVSGVAAYQEGSVNVADPGGRSAPERLASAKISASLIPLLEVAPRLGRTFTEEEDSPRGPAPVIISEGIWRSRFGADPHVVGRTLDVNGVSREVVGVMPGTFHFPSSGTKLWIPLALDPNDPFPGGFNYNAIARLRPGVSLASAQRDFRDVLPRVVEVSPMLAPGVSMRMVLDQAKLQPVITPLRDDMVAGISRTLWVVAAAAMLLLVVSCANVANLVMVRADGRQRELAVRAALGAGRLRVLTHFFTESLVIAALAGAIGLGVAAFGVRALVSAGPAELPRLAEVHVGGAVVLFTIVVTALVALACSAIPALRFGRAELAATLREGGRGGTEGRSRQRVRAGLVAAQIALAVVMLAGSGLLLRSFQRLNAVRPGWDPEHVATFWMSPAPARQPNDTALIRFYAELTRRVAQLPGVRSVGVTSSLPLLNRGVNTSPIWVEGDPSSDSRIPPIELFVTTDGGYFKTMSIPLVAGRTFESIDGRQRGDEAIVNQVTAERFWHDSTGANAIGKRFRTFPNGPWFTVIGVVASARDTSLESAPAMTVYFPEAVPPDTMFNEVARSMALVVRTAGDPTAITRPVEQVVRDLDPSLPMFDVRPMTEVVRASMARLSFTMLIIGVAALVTLVLGAIGLYGVIAYVVSLRTRELGVRIALGATPGSVAAMVTRQGMVLTAAGIAAGLALFVLVARFLRSLLFGVAPTDPLTLVAVSLVLVGIASLASWVPARRAARTDPMEALRAE